MEDRERNLAALDAAIERGMADINAGRVTGAGSVFDRLQAKHSRPAEARGEE